MAMHAAGAPCRCSRPTRSADRRFHCDQGNLHRHHALAQPGHCEEDRLRRGRVDGRCVARAIDVGKDGAVAQPGELRRPRHVAVGIDARGLHAPVPNIAVDVAGEIGLRHQHASSHRQPARQYDDERPRASGAPAEPRGRASAGGAHRKHADQCPSAAPFVQTRGARDQDRQGERHEGKPDHVATPAPSPVNAGLHANRLAARVRRRFRAGRARSYG